MVYRTLKLDAEGHVALLRLARSDDGNPVDEQFLQELDHACTSINDDPNVRVVLLTADGDAFSNGLPEPEAPPAARPDVPTFACLEALGQPVICAIKGDARGAGLELALACDVRVASEKARFAFPETARGTLPAFGGAQRLARLVGRAHALRILLLSDAVDAQEALRIGLVSALYPSDRLQDEAGTLALRMAARGPIALRYAKEAVRRGLDMPLDEALRMETDLTVILQTTEDRAEGVRAFIEKRRPEFKGR